MWNEYLKVTSWWCRNYWRFSGVSHRSQWKAESSFTSVSKSISGVQQLLKRLKDITTPDFSTNELFNPKFFYREVRVWSLGLKCPDPKGWMMFQPQPGTFQPHKIENSGIEAWHWKAWVEMCSKLLWTVFSQPRWLKSLKRVKAGMPKGENIMGYYY